MSKKSTTVRVLDDEPECFVEHGFAQRELDPACCWNWRTAYCNGAHLVRLELRRKRGEPIQAYLVLDADEAYEMGLALHRAYDHATHFEHK